jgi:hypothetical protein
MRRRPEESKLEALNGIDATADRAAQSATIKPFLGDKHFRVVAKAANLTGERSLLELIPDLLSAYARFLVDPVKRDPNCIAKGAIARALVTLGCDDVGFFLEGSRYRQPEPVWGGSADTAIDVRCSCAMGLVATGYSRAVQELTAQRTQSLNVAPVTAAEPGPKTGSDHSWPATRCTWPSLSRRGSSSPALPACCI